MDSPVNIHHFLCSDEVIQSPPPCQLLREVSDEELFETMDEIINRQYPDDHTYDVKEDDEEPPNKKPKIVDTLFDESQKMRLVKRMYGCKDTVKFFTSTEDRSIQERIETIFRQMKQTVK